jgi:hypothetical protein
MPQRRTELQAGSAQACTAGCPSAVITAGRATPRWAWNKRHAAAAAAGMPLHATCTIAPLALPPKLLHRYTHDNHCQGC